MILQITIPDAQSARIFDALAAKYKYTGRAEDGSAQTKSQFARQLMTDWIKGEVREYEQNEAATTARRGVTPLDF